MIKLIKEFIAFKKLTRAVWKIQLTDIEKTDIQNFNREIIKKIWDNVLNNLYVDIVNDELSKDYVMGAKHWIAMYGSIFRKYFKN